MMAARRLVGFLRHESDFGCMKMHPWFFDITVARRSQTCRIGGAFSTWSAVAEFEGIRANADTALDSAGRRRGHETKTGLPRGVPRGRRALRANSGRGFCEHRNSKIVPETYSFRISVPRNSDLVISEMSPPGARRDMVSFGAKKCHLVSKGDIREVMINPDCLAGHSRLSSNQPPGMGMAGLAGF